MNHKNKKRIVINFKILVTLLSAVLLISALIICSVLPSCSSPPYYSGIEKPSALSHIPSGLNPQESTNPKPSFTRSTRADSEDIVLTGTQEYGNITLSSFSRMIIKDADVTVNGVVTLTDSGTLFIIDSTVVINPPSIDENTSVMSLSDFSSIRISNSNVTVNSCPDPTSVPFVITDGDSSFIIDNSTFTAYIPAITEMITKIEGSFIASGNSAWIIQNSWINAEIDTVGGWFWFGLVGGSLDVIGSTFYFESHMVDLFAHSFGNMRIVDSDIIGRTMFEGTCTGEIINSTLWPEPNGFTSLGVIDSSSVTIKNSTFNGRVALNDKSVVEVYNSTFDENRGVRLAKNASLTLVDCIQQKCDLLQNATLSSYRSSDIEIEIQDMAMIGIYSNCSVSLNDSSVANLTLNEKDNLSLYTKNSTIYNLFTNDHAGIEGYMDDSTIDNLSLGKENAFNITMVNASDVVNIYSNMNCSFNITLVDDSIIENIARNEDKYLFTTLDSPLPEISGNNVTILIMHRLFIKTKLNDNDISTIVDISDDESPVISGQSENGAVTFVLLYQEINDSGTITLDEYHVSSSHFALAVTKNITLEESKELEINFEDHSPPVISNFKYEKNLWNLDKKVTSSMRIEVQVIDEDIQEVSNVTIRYSTDGGTTWHEMLMKSLGNNKYEGIIPEQEAETTVRFHVVANDIAHNSASTSIITYQESVGFLTIFWSIIIILLGFSIVAVAIKITKYRKIRRYLRKKSYRINETGLKAKT